MSYFKVTGVDELNSALSAIYQRAIKNRNLMKSFKIATIPAPKFADLSGLKEEILVIKIGEFRFLTIKAALPEFAGNVDSWLTYEPELAHHWTDVEAARGCAQDMALAYFRGQRVELVRLKLSKGVYRVA